jgi:hypothetical protein
MEKTELVAAFDTDAMRYRSYLLRLWRESPGEPWRCQVRCVGSGHERRFGSLARLFEFLEAEASEAPRVTQGEDLPGR